MTQERAADLVARDLQRRIISGSLANNSPLPAEKALCEEYAASRTVIREAITALTNRGMLENRPRFRPVVRKPGFEDAFKAMGSIVQHLTHESSGIETLYKSRVFIERALVREAATRAQSKDIRELRAALENNYEAIHDSQDFYDTDVAFHSVFYEIPQNPIFPAIHQAYTQWLAEHWKKMERSPQRNTLNYGHHQAIFDAVLERDADLAEALLEKHLDSAWEHVKHTFEV